MARLDQYTYVFVIGTFFAMLDAYNNGASTYILLASLFDLEQELTPLPPQTMSPTRGLPVSRRGPFLTDRP